MCQNLPAWACPSASEEVCVYYTPASLAVSDEQIAQAVIDLSKDGATCIIPNLSAAVDVYLAQQVLPHSMAADQQSQQRLAQAALEQEQDGVILAFYRRVYGVMVQAALRCGMKIAFHPDQPLERLVVRASDGAMHACMLTRREYYLNQEQHAQLVLSGQGTRMSTVAVDQRDGDTVDLSQWVTAEHSLDWDVPTGNWCVQEFLCCEDPAPHANYLNYDASCAYLQASFALLEDLFAGERRTVLGALYLDDIGFHAPNRRSWSPDFNCMDAIPRRGIRICMSMRITVHRTSRL